MRRHSWLKLTLPSGHVVTDEDVAVATLIGQLEESLGRPTPDLVRRVATTPLDRVHHIFDASKPAQHVRQPARNGLENDWIPVDVSPPQHGPGGPPLIASSRRIWHILWMTAIGGAIIGIVIVLLGRTLAPAPVQPPSAGPTSVQSPSAGPGPTVEIEVEPLVDAGVQLVAETRSETDVLFSWRILQEAPPGTTHFLTAELLNVDSGMNPHNEYYAWAEVNGDGSHPMDFADRPRGSVRVVQVFLVDQTCATYLRRGGGDTPHPKKLCNIGGVGDPDSDGLRVSVKMTRESVDCACRRMNRSQARRCWRTACRPGQHRSGDYGVRRVVRCVEGSTRYRSMVKMA